MAFDSLRSRVRAADLPSTDRYASVRDRWQPDVKFGPMGAYKLLTPATELVPAAEFLTARGWLYWHVDYMTWILLYHRDWLLRPVAEICLRERASDGRWYVDGANAMPPNSGSGEILYSRAEVIGAPSRLVAAGPEILETQVREELRPGGLYASLLSAARGAYTEWQEFLEARRTGRPTRWVLTARGPRRDAPGEQSERLPDGSWSFVCHGPPLRTLQGRGLQFPAPPRGDLERELARTLPASLREYVRRHREFLGRMHTVIRTGSRQWHLWPPGNRGLRLAAICKTREKETV